MEEGYYIVEFGLQNIVAEYVKAGRHERPIYFFCATNKGRVITFQEDECTVIKKIETLNV